MNIQSSYTFPINWPSLVGASKVMGPEFYQGQKIKSEEVEQSLLEETLRKEMLLKKLQNIDYNNSGVATSNVDIIGALLDFSA